MIKKILKNDFDFLFFLILAALLARFAALYALLRFADIGNRIEYVSSSFAGEQTTHNPFIQIPIALYSYIKLIFLPFNLTLYHEFAAFPKQEIILKLKQEKEEKI